MTVHTAEVAVKLEPGRLRRRTRHGERDAKDRVRTEASLVRRAVHRDEGGVEGTLVESIHADDGLHALLVHVVDGAHHTFSLVAIGIAIAKFDRFERARRSARGHHGAAEGAVVERRLDLHRGIAA